MSVVLIAHSKHSHKHFPLLLWLQRSSLVVCQFVFLFFALSHQALSDSISIEQIKASFLYNFAKHVEWPPSNKSEFKMALVGKVNGELVEALEVLEQHKTLLGRPIRVSNVEDKSTLTQFDLVYLSENSHFSLQEIFEVIEGKPILFVTYEQPNKRLVMLNLVRSENNTLQFELNKSNLINQGLQAKSELILLGGTEIDVAKLFREGQVSLLAIQKKLSNREKQLGELAKSIEGLEGKNVALREQLSQLDKKLAAQRLEIEKSEASRSALMQDIQIRKSELEKKNALLETIAEEIRVKEVLLSELNNTIKNQEGQINTLDDIVGSQRLVLRYLWATVALGFLLVITIFIAYAIKRRDNKKLKEHSQDLQMARDRLVLAKSKAESANEAKSEFLSLMSHELRTPLQAIIGYTEVVKEELHSEGEIRYNEDLNRVINNSDRLLKLINDVLDLAKAESGEMQLHISDIKLSTLTQEALDSVRPQIEKNNNTISLIVDDGKTLPKGDPEKILHILVNLLSNATKFTENGAICLTVKNDDEHMLIQVQDEGIGMDSSQLSTIFDRFKQVDSSSTRRFQGSGLGLSIVKKFVDQMSGDINVSSKLGVGTTFTITIPHLEKNTISKTLVENDAA